MSLQRQATIVHVYIVVIVINEERTYYAILSIKFAMIDAQGLAPARKKIDPSTYN